MKRKFPTLLFAAAALFAKAHALETAGPKSLTTTGMNALGYAGWNGELNAWWDVGVLEVSPNLRLPIRFNFNSAQKKIGKSILGWNWWMPLMESNVVKDSENHVLLHLPGGKKFDLWKSTKDPTLFKSNDEKWEGRVDERGNFRATNATEGIALDFFRGRLDLLKLATGETLRWYYDPSGKPVTIEDGSGNQLLWVVYDSNGSPKTIEYSSYNGLTKKIETGIEKAISGANQTLPVLTRLESTENNTKAFEYNILDETAISVTEINETDEGTFQEVKYAWNVTSGNLTSIGDETYLITKLVNDSISFSRKIGNNKDETFTYDNLAGIATHTLNANTVQRQYIQIQGNSYGKCRKFVVKDQSNKRIATENILYDSNGDVIRRVSQFGDTKRHPESNVIKIINLEGHTTVFKKITDGFIIEN